MIARKTSLKRSKFTLKRKSGVKIATGAKAKKKPKTVTKLKKELDTLFSKYIRAEFPPECYTCGFKGQMQCGHFITRGKHNTRFSEINCHCQCVGCNVFKMGNKEVYSVNLERQYGYGILQKLAKEGNESRCYTIKELQGLIEIYKEKYENLADKNLTSL